MYDRAKWRIPLSERQQLRLIQNTKAESPSDVIKSEHDVIRNSSMATADQQENSTISNCALGARCTKISSRQKLKHNRTTSMPLEMLSTASRPSTFELWTPARQRAWNRRSRDPDKYLMNYLFHDDELSLGQYCCVRDDRGNHQWPRKGRWSLQEHVTFIAALKEHFPFSNKWGLFSSHVPSRVGVQCRSYFRLLVRSGFVDRNTGRLKIHILHKSSVASNPVFLRSSVRKFLPQILPTLSSARRQLLMSFRKKQLKSSRYSVAYCDFDSIFKTMVVSGSACPSLRRQENEAGCLQLLDDVIGLVVAPSPRVEDIVTEHSATSEEFLEEVMCMADDDELEETNLQDNKQPSANEKACSLLSESNTIFDVPDPDKTSPVIENEVLVNMSIGSKRVNAPRHQSVGLAPLHRAPSEDTKTNFGITSNYSLCRYSPFARDVRDSSSLLGRNQALKFQDSCVRDKLQRKDTSAIGNRVHKLDSVQKEKMKSYAVELESPRISQEQRKSKEQYVNQENMTPNVPSPLNAGIESRTALCRSHGNTSLKSIANAVSCKKPPAIPKARVVLRVQRKRCHRHDVDNVCIENYRCAKRSKLCSNFQEAQQEINSVYETLTSWVTSCPLEGLTLGHAIERERLLLDFNCARANLEYHLPKIAQKYPVQPSPLLRASHFLMQAFVPPTKANEQSILSCSGIVRQMIELTQTYRSLIYEVDVRQTQELQSMKVVSDLLTFA